MVGASWVDTMLIRDDFPELKIDTILLNFLLIWIFHIKHINIKLYMYHILYAIQYSLSIIS